jgi:hypothetical protein
MSASPSRHCRSGWRSGPREGASPNSGDRHCGVQGSQPRAGWRHCNGSCGDPAAALSVTCGDPRVRTRCQQGRILVIQVLKESRAGGLPPRSRGGAQCDSARPATRTGTPTPGWRSNATAMRSPRSCTWPPAPAGSPPRRGNPTLTMTMRWEHVEQRAGRALLDGKPPSATALRRLRCDALIPPAVLGTRGSPGSGPLHPPCQHRPTARTCLTGQGMCVPPLHPHLTMSHPGPPRELGRPRRTSACSATATG